MRKKNTKRLQRLEFLDSVKSEVAQKIGSDYSDKLETLETSQVIIEHGTKPLDQLYFDLKDKELAKTWIVS